MGNKRFGISISTKDKSTKIINGIVQYDTGNVFYMTITEDGSPVDLSDTAEIILNIKKPDGTEIMDCTGEKLRAINKAKGNIEFTCDGQCVTAKGLYSCTLTFYDTSGIKITTARFDYYVTESLDSTAIDSTSDYPFVQQMYENFYDMWHRGIGMVEYAHRVVEQAIEAVNGDYATKSYVDGLISNSLDSYAHCEYFTDDDSDEYADPLLIQLKDLFTFTDVELTNCKEESYLRYAIADDYLLIFLRIVFSSNTAANTLITLAPIPQEIYDAIGFGHDGYAYIGSNHGEQAYFEMDKFQPFGIKPLRNVLEDAAIHDGFVMFLGRGE